jgi:glycosyltransferase involved in cell wall biosynthesis
MITPEVSVVIPVYNGEQYLREAIESVLGQDYRPIQLIVVDDGSTDRSADIARSFGSDVHYRFQPNRGIGAARNTGTELARGSFLAFLDADDVWMPGKLTRQMAAFAADPALDMVFGLVRQFSSRDRQEPGTEQPPENLFQGYLAGAMLIKHDSFLRAGLFDTKWVLGEFIDWYLRVIEQGLKSVVLQDVVLARRIHDDNVGVRERHHRHDYLRVVRAALERRRATERSALKEGKGRNEADSGSDH